MTALSKPIPQVNIITHRTCQEVLHPWTNNCYVFASDVFFSSMIGSHKFFLPIYIFKILLKGRNLSKDYLKQVIKSLLYSTAFGTFLSFISFLSSCFFRNVLNKFTYFTIACVPGIVGGFSIFFEHPTQRQINITMCLIQVCSFVLRQYMNVGVNKHSLRLETLMFMLISGGLLYSLQMIENSYTTLWFFVPRLKKLKQGQCTHEGDCIHDILQTGITYFSFGMLIQLIRILISNYKYVLTSPRSLLSLYLQKKTIMLGLFAGSYVSLYKTVSCCLYQARGKNESWHSFLAGFTAGIGYFFQPNIFLISAGISNLLQILGREFQKKMDITHWPTGEVAFAVAMGILFHCRLFHTESIPPYVYFAMDAITNKRTIKIYNSIISEMTTRLHL